MTMHADHDTAIRAALAQVRDDMRAGVITARNSPFQGSVMRHLLWELRIGGNEADADRILRRQFSDPLLAGLLWSGLPQPISEMPAAIDRYLAGDEPWPAMETT